MRRPHFLLDLIAKLIFWLKEEQIKRFIVDAGSNDVVELNRFFLIDHFVPVDIDFGDEVEEGLQSCSALEGHPLVSTDQCTLYREQLVLC